MAKTMSPKVFVSFLLVALLHLIRSAPNPVPYEPAVTDTLVLVQTIFRHGDRTPEKFYPTDPNNGNWPDGMEQLTSIGIQQQYELGQFVRNRYAGFINGSYYHENVKVAASDVDRCLMSAYAQLAGAYPPASEEVWNSAIPWQPIPVHTMPLSEDYWLSHDAPCPNYDDLLDEQKNSNEMADIDKKYANLYDLLTTNTGTNVNDIFDVADIYDTTFCEISHGMTIPSWITPDVLEQMSECHNLKYIFKSKTTDMVRLRGGGAIDKIVQHMKDFQDGQLPNLEIVFLSSHETELSAIMNGMGVYNGIDPPYAASLFFELHNQAGNYVVQMFYRNDTTQPLQELVLPGCSTPCPYSTFHDLTDPLTPGSDIAVECGA
ncbi:mitochondrial acyl carrier protein [Chamberlinius hualienensis]